MVPSDDNSVDPSDNQLSTKRWGPETACRQRRVEFPASIKRPERGLLHSPANPANLLIHNGLKV
jgi:hypothetical protein